jgi:hypothetical protein
LVSVLEKIRENNVTSIFMYMQKNTSENERAASVAWPSSLAMMTNKGDAYAKNTTKYGSTTEQIVLIITNIYIRV